METIIKNVVEEIWGNHATIDHEYLIQLLIEAEKQDGTKSIITHIENIIKK